MGAHNVARRDCLLIFLSLLFAVLIAAAKSNIDAVLTTTSSVGLHDLLHPLMAIHYISSLVLFYNSSMETESFILPTVFAPTHIISTLARLDNLYWFDHARMTGWIAFATLWIAEHSTAVKLIVAASITYALCTFWTLLGPHILREEVMKPVSKMDTPNKTYSTATHTNDSDTPVHEELGRLLTREQIDAILSHRQVEQAKVIAILESKVDPCQCDQWRAKYDQLSSEYDRSCANEEQSATVISHLRKQVNDEIIKQPQSISCKKQKFKQEDREELSNCKNRTIEQQNRAEKAEEELTKLKADLNLSENLVKDLQEKLRPILPQVETPLPEQIANTLFQSQPLIKRKLTQEQVVGILAHAAEEQNITECLKLKEDARRFEERAKRLRSARDKSLNTVAMLTNELNDTDRNHKAEISRGRQQAWKYLNDYDKQAEKYKASVEATKDELFNSEQTVKMLRARLHDKRSSAKIDPVPRSSVHSGQDDKVKAELKSLKQQLDEVNSNNQVLVQELEIATSTPTPPLLTNEDQPAATEAHLAIKAKLDAKSHAYTELESRFDAVEKELASEKKSGVETKSQLSASQSQVTEQAKAYNQLESCLNVAEQKSHSKVNPEVHLHLEGVRSQLNARTEDLDELEAKFEYTSSQLETKTKACTELKSDLKAANNKAASDAIALRDELDRAWDTELQNVKHLYEQQMNGVQDAKASAGHSLVIGQSRVIEMEGNWLSERSNMQSIVDQLRADIAARDAQQQRSQSQSMAAAEQVWVHNKTSLENNMSQVVRQRDDLQAKLNNYEAESQKKWSEVDAEVKTWMAERDAAWANLNTMKEERDNLSKVVAWLDKARLTLSEHAEECIFWDDLSHFLLGWNKDNFRTGWAWFRKDQVAAIAVMAPEPDAMFPAPDAVAPEPDTVTPAPASVHPAPPTASLAPSSKRRGERLHDPRSTRSRPDEVVEEEPASEPQKLTLAQMAMAGRMKKPCRGARSFGSGISLPNGSFGATYPEVPLNEASGANTSAPFTFPTISNKSFGLPDLNNPALPRLPNGSFGMAGSDSFKDDGNIDPLFR